MTVILVGFAQHGFEEEDIQMFVKIAKQGFWLTQTWFQLSLGHWELILPWVLVRKSTL